MTEYVYLSEADTLILICLLRGNKTPLQITGYFRFVTLYPGKMKMHDRTDNISKFHFFVSAPSPERAKKPEFGMS